MNEEFKEHLSYFATGITVITTKFKGKIFGITVNSFNSVSLDPPIILYSLDKGVMRFNAFYSSEEFCVNILSCDQRSVSEDFASNNSDRWKNHFIDDLRIKNSISGFLCITRNKYEEGDHIIITANVKNYFFAKREVGALVYYNREYYKIGNE